MVILGIVVGLGFMATAPADEPKDELKKEILEELEKKLDDKMADLKKDLLDAIKEATKKPEPKRRPIVEQPGGKHGEPDARLKPRSRLLKKNFFPPELECPHCGKNFSPDWKALIPDFEDIEDFLRRLPDIEIEEDIEFEFPRRLRRLLPRQGEMNPNRFFPRIPDDSDIEDYQREIKKYLDEIEKMLERLEKSVPGYEPRKEQGDERPRFRFRILPGNNRVPKKFFEDFERKLEKEGEADEEYEEEFELPEGGKGKVKVRIKGLKSDSGPEKESERSIEIEKKLEKNTAPNKKEEEKNGEEKKPEGSELKKPVRHRI
jgi:hypothetical protein